MIRKIILFPIRMLLMLAEVLLELFIKIECWAAGIVFLALGTFILIALINQMWLQMGILVGFAFVTLFVLFLTAEIKLSLELLIEKMA